MTKPKIRTLLVDDEQPARRRLQQLLKAFPTIEVIGEAEDGEEAMERIAELTPDLVLLDIQMPGANGLEVAAALAQPRPHIIFCTAYDQYAVDAFELHAVDYLLKPVSRVRLRQAVDRLSQPPVVQDDALDRTTREAPLPRRFLAKRGARYQVVPEGEVLYFGSEDGLTKLCTSQFECWMQPTLTDLEKRLNSAAFYRISRAAIVNLASVTQVVPLIGGHGEVVLRNGVRLDVSRRRFKGLLELLGDL